MPLYRLRDDYAASVKSWEDCCNSWADEKGLHRGDDVLEALDNHFERRSCNYGSYFWADLAATSIADEQLAIDSGEIQATGIYYLGRKADGNSANGRSA